MADVNLAAIKLATLYRDEISKSLRTGSELLRVIEIAPGRSGVSNGNSVVVDGYEAAAINLAEAGTWASTETAGTQLVLTQAWARIGKSCQLSTDAIKLAHATGNPGDLFDLMKREMKKSCSSIASRMGSQFFSGAGTSNTIAGLDLAIGDTTTYGGLLRSDAANYPIRSYVVDPGSPTTLTKTHVRDDIAAIKDKCGERPNLAICTSTVLNKVKAAFDSVIQYQVPTLGGGIQLNNSFDSITIDNCTFMADDNATAGVIYYCNRDEMRLRVVPSLPGESVLFPVQEGVGLPVEFQALPNDALVRRFAMHVQCQLEISAPSKFGKRLNVA